VAKGLKMVFALVVAARPDRPVPTGKTGKRALFLNCNCISPESPGRRLIEEIEVFFSPGTGLLKD
jgi:hypothetical protein